MGNKNQFVDELLDSALAHHRAAQPRPGLEARLLDGVRASAVERKGAGKVWKLWLAVAATTAVLTFVAIRVANRSHSTAAQSSQAANVVPSTPPKETLTANSGAVPKTGSATTVVEPKRIAERESKPSPRATELSRQVEAHHWPSQFPTPAPLTPQQKALVEYVRETPPKVLSASLFPHEFESRPTEIEPVKISTIEIQPLTVIKPGEELQ